jgi:diguanylate cyclase (GGDEF)-like protein
MKLLLELAGDVSFALDHIEKEEKLDYLAYYDSLTGLANRSLFHERLMQYVSAAQSDKSTLAVAVVDVDRFKTINDTLGRQAGDDLLRQIAERIERHAGPVRMARISADRFAIVRSGVSSEREVARLIEEWLAECFGPPYLVSGAELRVSAKAGIALFPNDGADADALFQNAEAALKKAKATGDRYLFHTQQMTERIGEKLALENKLRQAVEREQFVLHYQPQVDTVTRRIESVEALIRWQSPELGLVPPLQFIPLLEETGLILEVGAWALRRAVLDHRTLMERGLPAPRIAVNVSPIQLRKRDFVASVEEAMRLGSVPAGIDLEITESLVMEDIEANMKKLEAMRLLGVSIAIDDFGTGYSSLAYLAKLPVHSLKIDRSFIITMLKDAAIMTLVSTIISLAHSFNLKVVAEGVDAEEQAEVLKRLGCDGMQGFLFSKPVDFDAMTVLIGKRKGVD